MDYKLTDSALIFAAKAHDGQCRKGTDIPYITHPVLLAMTLQEYDCDGEVIAAALLHDVVEDTDVTFADIEHRFGARVEAIVRAVTEPDRGAPWEERKQHTIDKLRDAPLEVKLVAGADKLHNVRSMVRDYAEVGDALWSRFGRGREKQAWYYQSLAESLSAGIDAEKYPIFTEFSQEVHNLFGDN